LLRIRLQRIGRKNLPAYRIVVAEKSQAVKKKYIDLVGHYLPTQNPKVLEVDQDKIKEWISKGAQPTDTVASLLKGLGMSDMDKYISFLLLEISQQQQFCMQAGFFYRYVGVLFLTSFSGLNL
jgi:small subunit ribosomal protein S16